MSKEKKGRIVKDYLEDLLPLKKAVESLLEELA